jgi:GAF domain-containing protein
MKNSLRKQAFVLALVGLAVTGLVLFTNIARQRYEARIQQIDALQEAVSIPIAYAKSNYKNLPSDADPATVNKEVLVPLEGARTVLQDLYDGKEIELSKLVEGSETVKVLIKLAMVEVDKTIESVKAKIPDAGFDTSLNEAGNVEKHFVRQATSQHQVLEGVSWTTVLVLVLLFTGIAVWNYVSDKGRLKGSLQEHEQLLRETKRVDTLSNFIEAMATGNYSVQLETEKNDELSATLVTMRDKLKMNAEEDQRRNWATSGLAQIGELLRATTRTSSDLYDGIIKFVVKYTRSNQGGLFIINDDDAQNSYLELVACYAFERKKFLTKRVDPGQGLVGQCFLEKERIHLREVPQDYIRITSGLGGENPKSCLLVPLRVNDAIYGVLELASFNLYADFEIELVEKLAETIASTISSVKINESTRMLLERTQQQAEEMKSQEEEMRQNMEELSATQEEMQRKEGEYIQRIQELEGQLGVVAK